MASAQESNADMDTVKVGGEEEGTSENDPSIGTETDRTDKSQDFCLEILPLVKEAQNQHGLRHGDYRSYRLYCSRRVRRIRKSLHFTQGRRHRYVGKAITSEIITDIRFLQIPLVCAERAWAYAMQLKQDAENEMEYRKKHHLQRKLHKANLYAQELLSLCDSCPRCDPRTKLEADAYAKWMRGNLHFERQEWKEAFDCFGSAQTIYEQLASAVVEQHRGFYHQRVNEITPSIRYCAYNIGDMPSDVKELTKLRVSTPGYELLASKIDVVIAETRAKAASTLTEVSWCGKKLPVKSEKIRICLVHLKELSDEVQRKSDDDAACEQLCEQVVMECHEAMQTLRDELSQDKREGEKKMGKGDLETSSIGDLQSYVTHIKLTHSIRRNLLLIKLMQASQKRYRPDEYVRLYDSLLQNSSELESLPGLSDDLEQQKLISAQSYVFKAHRAFYLAMSYADNGKWAEAIGLYDRTAEHISQATKLYKESSGAGKEGELTDLQKLNDRTRGQRCVAQVSLFGGENDKKEVTTDSVTPLLSRLDEALTIAPNQKLPPLAPMPPELQPIPCKPLFFDLAKNFVEFPDLDHRVKEKGKDQQGGGGLLGWFWGKK